MKSLVSNYWKSLLVTATAVFTAANAGTLDYPSIWKCDGSTKFNWYCEEEIQQQSQKTERPVESAPAKQQRIEINDLKTAEEMRQELKRREDLAVMVPTEANLKDYLELWKVVQDRSSLFADQWRRVVWQNADLDYSTQRPVNNSAAKTFNASSEKAQEVALQELAKSHGLIFFFRSDCPYCKAEAPVLKQLSEEYGFEVLAVSVNGGSLPEFPNPADGTKVAASWGVEKVPALFIGSKETGDHAAIGFGQMAKSEIINRIYVLTSTEAGESF